ncbi:hypothetical protein HPB47_023602, partial [Ixodes persulcatus]
MTTPLGRREERAQFEASAGTAMIVPCVGLDSSAARTCTRTGVSATPRTGLCSI